MTEPIICIREINENIRRVYAGEELTRPLKELNTSCEFRKKYDEFCVIQEGDPYKKSYKIVTRKICEICGKKEFIQKGNRKYCSEDCQKAGDRLSRQKPERKEQKRIYDEKYSFKNRAKKIEYSRAYRKRPEVIAREQTPEARIRRAGYSRAYYQRKKLGKIQMEKK